MVRSCSYPPSMMSDAQVQELTARLVVCTDRMTHSQILTMTDALHAVLSRRKKGRTVGFLVEVRA